MNSLLTGLATILISVTAMAGHHGSAEAEVRSASEAFNAAYVNNDVEAYFSYYADDSNVFFYGQRQDMSAYHEEWSAMIEAGGGVEVNDVFDVVIQELPGGKAGIASYFVSNRTRSADGEISTEKAFETEVWQKTGGEWKVVNLHYTVLSAEE